MVPWNAAKAKVRSTLNLYRRHYEGYANIALRVQRLRTLQEKKAAQAKAARRDIAVLLEKNKLETARIKVENIINEDIHIELLELLELYCELLLARFGLLDQNTREPDPGVSEGVCAIIHAAPRTELKELHILRDILMHKYGRDFSIAVMENKDGCVTERITKKLVTHTPSAELVDAYLAEIAKGYGVEWVPRNGSKDDGDNGGEGGVKASCALRSLVSARRLRPRPEVQLTCVLSQEPEKTKELESPLPDATAISAEARKAGVRTPKLPEMPPTEEEESSEDTPSKGLVKPAPPEDDFEALAKRFAALKKR
ncbi:hypothetical protein NM688_g1999 [Phlebia brevispora]|uniref:Uncharacterized protein n=1 Tax=Phlebia brevispora TaxID=194682 RepID=A0ACC1TA04_9APHY|nr:hypothetical protein NM688_g1999 [Phlebia brevispora]